MTKKEAINALQGRGREIVTVEYASKIAEAFGKDIRDLNVIYTAEAGVDFGTGTERWEGGEMVDISTLAWVLAQDLPDIDYDTNYIGSGKRSAAVAAKAAIKLRIAAGEAVPSCEDCGSYDLWQSQETPLCWSCLSNRQDRVAFARINATTHAAGYKINGRLLTEDETEYSVFKGREQIRFGKLNWEFKSLDKALVAAYRANKKDGLIGPVNMSHWFHGLKGELKELRAYSGG